MSELQWNWVYYPYLDAPNKQEESALKAGYIKVVSKSDADKVLAEKDKEIAELKTKITKSKELADGIRCDIEKVKADAAETLALLEERNKQIGELKEERQWRKFPEEKPNEDIKFLVINEKDFMQCCYYSSILQEFQIPVKHWMPLPPAPKEDK